MINTSVKNLIVIIFFSFLFCGYFTSNNLKKVNSVNNSNKNGDINFKIYNDFQKQPKLRKLVGKDYHESFTVIIS